MDCDDEELIYWQQFGGKHYTETDDSIAEKEFKELLEIKQWLCGLLEDEKIDPHYKDMALKTIKFLEGKL